MKNIIITGASRGIGKEVLSMLFASPYPTSFIIPFRTSPDKVLPELISSHPNHRISYHSLDISDPSSISDFAKWYSSEKGSVSVLINNAGYGLFDDIMSKIKPTEQVIRQTLNTNLYGLINLTESLLPNFEDEAKIVNVSAIMGQLQFQKTSIKQKLLNDKLETKDIIELAHSYERQSLGKEENDWNQSSYRASKALVNAYTRFALPKLLKENQSCIAVCPGWCKTDLGTEKAQNSAKSGAEKIVFAMNQLGKNEFHGQFLCNNKIIKESA
jgi:carbonyl reductase 1